MHSLNSSLTMTLAVLFLSLAAQSDLQAAIPPTSASGTAAAHDDVQTLTEDFYRDLLTRMNPEKRRQWLEQSMENPEQFLQELSPAMRQRLQDMAAKNRESDERQQKVSQ